MYILITEEDVIVDFMTIGTIVVVLAVVLLILRSVFGIKLKELISSKKSISKKVESIMKRDFSSKFARCTFYAFHDYSNGYAQSEWMDYYKQRTQNHTLDKNSQEYTEAIAPLMNAIVVDEHGYYARRGGEDMYGGHVEFIPGNNDRISLNYFIEPYEYVKTKGHTQTTKRPQTRDDRDSSVNMAYAELRKAQAHYIKAKNIYEARQDSSMAGFYKGEADKAYAAMLSAQIKYDSLKK